MVDFLLSVGIRNPRSVEQDFGGSSSVSDRKAQVHFVSAAVMLDSHPEHSSCRHHTLLHFPIINSLCSVNNSVKLAHFIISICFIYWKKMLSYLFTLELCSFSTTAPALPDPGNF